MPRKTMPVASVVGLIAAIVSARLVGGVVSWPTPFVWVAAAGIGLAAAIIAVFLEGVVRSLRTQTDP